MNRESLRETLSAVMDNEADELELRRALAASGEPDVRAAWSRYQIARAAMRGDYFSPGLNIAAGVSAALAQEPAPAPARTSAPLWRGIGRVAIAASVTLAVLAGVRFYNQDSLDAGAQMARQTAPTLPAGSSAPMVQGPAVLAGYNPGSEAATLAVPVDHEAQLAEDQRLLDYVRQHARQAGTGAESTLPNARAASLENR